MVHLEGIANALKQAETIHDVVLAFPDDEFHREKVQCVSVCDVFMGDAANMNLRLAEAAGSRNATRIVDCSMLTQCLDPILYDKMVEYHISSPGPMTCAHLWYPEFLPKIVESDTLFSIAAQKEWPYYSHVPAEETNLFVPDVDEIARFFSFLDPLCQELVIHKGKQLRSSMNLTVNPFDPTLWAARCKNLLPRIEKLFKRRSISVLEVGCGKRFGLGLMLKMAGIERYAGIDLNLKRLTDEQVSAFSEWVAYHYEQAAIPGMDLQRISRDEENADFDSFFNRMVEFRSMDACNLDYPDSSFDFIYSDAVLEHVGNCELAIEEMYRVLKPGGIAYHKIDLVDHFTEAGDSHLYMSKDEWGKIHPPLINLVRPSDFYAWFTKAGFKTKKLTEYKYPELDTPRIHQEYLTDGLSEARTYATHILLQKPE